MRLHTLVCACARCAARQGAGRARQHPRRVCLASKAQVPRRLVRGMDLSFQIRVRNPCLGRIRSLLDAGGGEAQGGTQEARGRGLCRPPRSTGPCSRRGQGRLARGLGRPVAKPLAAGRRAASGLRFDQMLSCKRFATRARFAKIHLERPGMKNECSWRFTSFAFAVISFVTLD